VALQLFPVLRAEQRRSCEGGTSEGMEAGCFDLGRTIMETGSTSSAQQVLTSVFIAGTLSTLVIGGALLTTIGA
jgi:hypothetical protein